MRIGVIQASSQASKNQIIYDAVCKYAPKESEVVNFGCTMEERNCWSDEINNFKFRLKVLYMFWENEDNSDGT